MNISTFYYLILCIIFVGGVDEHWNNQSVDKTHQNFEVLEDTVGMESGSWSYEDNFGVAADKDSYSNSIQKFVKFIKRNRDTSEDFKREKNDYKLALEEKIVNSMNKTYNRVKNISDDGFDSVDLLKFQNYVSLRRSKNPKWPKFEDLLLSIGVEYDWKSDRWIKIKEKVTKSSYENFKVIPQKHEFKYRTVRINGSKRRKNVIIAVTAVR